jgi:hypothetical protein
MMQQVQLPEALAVLGSGDLPFVGKIISHSTAAVCGSLDPWMELKILSAKKRLDIVTIFSPEGRRNKKKEKKRKEKTIR